jgi:hypothetical protein
VDRDQQPDDVVVMLREDRGPGVFEVGGNASVDAPKREEDAEGGLELRGQLKTGRLRG